MAKPAFKAKRNRARAASEQPRGRKAAQEPARRKKAPPEKPAPEEPSREPRPRYDGERPRERIGAIVERAPSDDFELLDTGNGRKLERYGTLVLDRPEAQALWQPALAEWRADARFTGDTEEEGAGRWAFEGQGQETWPLRHDAPGGPILYHGRFTAFRHVGVFPEQAPHWHRMARLIRARLEQAQADETPCEPVRVLNLFGYTGLASLVAARAGAEVTHVDASRKAIGWARDNAALAGLEDAPVRWICDDAVRFCERERRRGRSYDVILLDPPAFGRGPKGETWHFFDDVAHLVDLARALQSPRPLMSVLTSYAIRASHLACHELMRECFAGLGGTLLSGELVLRDRAGRALSTSMFSRWEGPHGLLGDTALDDTALDDTTLDDTGLNDTGLNDTGLNEEGDAA